MFIHCGRHMDMLHKVLPLYHARIDIGAYHSKIRAAPETQNDYLRGRVV